MLKRILFLLNVYAFGFKPITIWAMEAELSKVKL